MSALSVIGVILTYNRLSLLQQVLASLREQTYPLDQIIIVENASTDGTRTYLDNLSDPAVHILKLDRNVGSAGGFAAGFEAASRTGHDLVWVMDDDVLPEPDALDALVRAYCGLVAENCRPNVLLSSVVNEAGEPNNVPVLDLRAEGNAYPGWPKRLGRGLLPILRGTFVGTLFPREAIERNGVPIAELFIWFDDYEYTSRLTRTGPGFLVAAAVVKHLGRPGTLSIHDQVSPERLGYFFYFYRNMIFMARNYYGTRDVLGMISGLARDVAKLIAAGERTKLLTLLRGILAGLAFRPRMAPRPELLNSAPERSDPLSASQLDGGR